MFKNKKVWILGGIAIFLLFLVWRGFFGQEFSGTSKVSYYDDGVDYPADLSRGESISRPPFSDMDDAVPSKMFLGRQVATEGKMKLTTEEIESDELVIDRLVIKTGSLSVLVQDVSEALEKVNKFAVERGGFIVSSYLDGVNTVPFGEIVIKFPSEEFDDGVEELGSLGEVTSERVDGRDVTEEFVDLGAQLKNLRATEEQFLNIMKQAFKIEDILAVQRELSNVRNNIERIEGRMKYLQESADLSTLTIYLSTDPSALPVLDDEYKWKPWGVVKDAARSLVDELQYMAEWVIWAVVYVPIVLIYLAILWIIYRVVMVVKKRFKNNKQ